MGYRTCSPNCSEGRVLQIQEPSVTKVIGQPSSQAIDRPCADAYLDPPLWIVPNKASLSLSVSLSLRSQV
jgi:hypothetical protein